MNLKHLLGLLAALHLVICPAMAPAAPAAPEPSRVKGAFFRQPFPQVPPEEPEEPDVPAPEGFPPPEEDGSFT